MTRIHIVSLPHTLLTRDYDWCAYTAKVRRFISMVESTGHHAIVYGPDRYDLGGRPEYVTIATEDDRRRWFGRPEWDAAEVFDRWDANEPCWVETNASAAHAIRQRWQPGDVLGIIAGWCQQEVVQQLADLQPLVCEWGIGYSGVLPGTHKVFESYAWMHAVAGMAPTDDMAFYDTVIPNCFDVEDYIASDTVGDYLLFMGRPTPRKGLPIIAELAQRSDIPIVMAGQPGATIPGTHHVGLVLGQDKAELLAGARAVLTPTTYLEPFGGVAVEAMLSGTPVIATDYGAFTETVQHGVTGYRCRLLADFLHAIEAVTSLDRAAIRDLAVKAYSTQRGAHLYGTYIDRLATLYGDGWYHDTPPTSARS